MSYKNLPSYRRLCVLHAERRRPIVFWVGAGLSIPAGLPGWRGLRDILISRALEIAATLEPAKGREKEIEIERAQAAVSLWDSFEILKSNLGITEYKEGIREVFSRASGDYIPQLYSSIWDLPGVRGVATLNIDEYATKSHRRTRPGEDPADFVGADVADYAHILSSGRPFIANLHGIMDSQKSWIFTGSEISKLVSSPGYREFISLIFGQMSVVFCGISADDGAAGGFLHTLTASGLDLGQHFWITDRQDKATHEWAADAGIGVIRYTPVYKPGGESDHTTPLLELFGDIKKFISIESPVGPIVPDVRPLDKLPSESEILAKDADDLRTTLSGYAKFVLSKGDSEANTLYQQFLDNYARCIHQAWWLTQRAPNNKFYGYEVIEKVSSSKFSNVWALQDGSGNKFALKVLSIENISGGAEIDSFRRSVKSLEYLTAASVPGTPTLHHAFEIPTSYVMEYVNGSSLQEIAAQRSFDFWRDGLLILDSVCDHLIYGHNLPQGVLHRDVRPSNIMVPHYYSSIGGGTSNPEKYNVKLLNYDLSWHKDAGGRVISGNMEESGYYSPEHIVAGERFARTTLVDSYGIGMCIYFAFSKQKPPTGGSKSTDWKKLLETTFRINSRLAWHSAPIRVRRLIEQATAPDPQMRITLDRIRSELSLIREAVEQNFERLPPDFWAEELISRSEAAAYEVDVTGSEFRREPRAGRIILFSGNLRRRSVVVRFSNQAQGYTNKSSIDRIWREKLSSARDILVSAGWDIGDETRAGNMEILLRAEAPVDRLKDKIDRMLSGLRRALEIVRLD